MSAVEPAEVVEAIEDHRRELLALSFPIALAMLYISQTGLPILPITSTILLIGVVVVFYVTLFVDKIEV